MFPLKTPGSRNLKEIAAHKWGGDKGTDMYNVGSSYSGVESILRAC